MDLGQYVTLYLSFLDILIIFYLQLWESECLITDTRLALLISSVAGLTDDISTKVSDILYSKIKTSTQCSYRFYRCMKHWHIMLQKST